MIYVYPVFKWTAESWLHNRVTRLLSPFQWHHNQRDGVSNSRLFTQSFVQAQIKETPKLCVIGEIPARKASNAKNVSVWWRHHERGTNRKQYKTQKRTNFMKTSSNGSIFRVTGHLCEEFMGHRWFPRTKASHAELWYFLYLCLNKGLSKQWWGWWFETPSRPLWRHCNVCIKSCEK